MRTKALRHKGTEALRDAVNLCKSAQSVDPPPPSSSPRTEEQNAYYWGVALPAIAAGLSDAWGESYTAEQAHEICKQLFLAKPTYDRAADVRTGQTDPSTATLTIAAFGEYLDKIRLLAAEFLHVEIPLPDPSSLDPVP